jgi:F420H(2)-dependent quinone reductase
MRPLVRRVVHAANRRVAALLASPRWGARLGRSMVVITYVGRRSGRTFSTPVSYRRAGDEVTIGVAMADAKSWWRNFLGGGGPISLRLDGTDRPGHAVARRDDRGRVTLTVRLDPC